MDFKTPTLELYARGLNHADPYIRNECLDLICKNPELSVEHSRVILKQLTSVGSQAYACFERVIDHFPHDATTLEQLFELCTQWAQNGEEDPSLAAYYLRWCLNTKVELHSTVQQALNNTDPALLTVLNIDLLRNELQRISQIAQWDEAATLKEIEGLGDRFMLPNGSTLDFQQWIKRLCQHLTHIMPHQRLAELTREWLNLATHEESSHGDHLKTNCAIYLCGILSLEDQAPQLLELCESTFGSWDEEVEESFTLMNSPSALQLIQQRWDTLTELTRSSLSEVYQALAPTQFDAFYSSILERDIDEYDDYEFYITESVARAYVLSGSQQALDDCQRLIDKYDITADHHEAFKLIVALYTHTILRDYQPERIDDLQRRLAVFNSEPSELESTDLDWLQNEAYEPSLPIRKEAKVGRNDPCPCGSGKKHKKCCL
jgi:hypothetical protein